VTLLIAIAGICVLLAVLALALFGRWLSRAWTVIDEADPTGRGSAGSLWLRLGEAVGRGPRRLTYRRDERGRFRRHRR
jgi:hypothetical protein